MDYSAGKLPKLGTKALVFIFLVLFFLGPINFLGFLPAVHAAESDQVLYEKYENYLRYDKREKYRKYKKAKDRYGFESSSEKAKCKSRYAKYKLYKKNPKKYSAYSIYAKEYKKYKKYQEEVSKYSKYAKYSKYDKSKYAKAEYAKYGGEEYRKGHERYAKLLKIRGEATLGGGTLGPTISVGLWKYTRDQLRDDDFHIEANKSYKILDKNGAVIATVDGGTETRVNYDSDKNLEISESIPDRLVNKEVRFEAADGDNSTIIFDAHRPDSSFDQYRGKMELRYSDATNSIWVINRLPLEHYVWGMGEITGTGDEEYNRVMTTSFRTYGYWKIKFSTKYATEGFLVDATPGNQMYYGYDWEVGHSRIKAAAQETRGTIVMYGPKIAITPYSSWTDGRTRSFEERWGSEDYPWCKSVKDSYGKHPSKSTSQLESEGNHMVGLSANGALKLASEHDWDWKKILKYYYTGITLHEAY